MAEKAGNKGQRDRIGRILYVFYIFFLIGAVVLVGKIISVQFFFKPDPAIEAKLTPPVTKDVMRPARGAILARDGRMLAISFPSYTIAMDPSVLKDEFASDRTNGAQREQEWLEKARALSEGLVRFFPEKTASEYYDMIRKDREQGKRYRAIGTPVDYDTMQEIRKLPLFREGQFKGGLIVAQKDVRQYPYGTLARRVIGFVRDNTDASSNNYIGIEGKFNSKLHGQEGYRYRRRTDANKTVQSNDSTAVKPVDGLDVRTTLDVDIQDLADRSLRAQIDTNRKIEGGCAVVMDVATGAIRAMVNLKRDPKTGRMEESYNYAIGRAGEPGSVFKASTIMTLLEDGCIHSLEETIPTNHGKEGTLPLDQHIYDYERQYGTNEITILRGLEMSSNYVFAHLAIQHYAKRPKDFIDKLYMYKLGEAFDFDLDGMASPSVPSPDRESWSATSLGTTAYGYSVTETPLHILTFYNAIANKGKMMKPYLVEDIEKNGTVKEKLGPSILNASICSRATADTITRGLTAVVQSGTATRLKNTKFKVAGKTGTARIVLDAQDSKTAAGRYNDEWGRKKNQATFVGFFPAEAPKYSFIVVIYSVLSGESFYGGTLPALAARDIVDGIWAMDPVWMDTLEPQSAVPPMPSQAMLAQTEDSPTVPDLTGLGLRDALYAVESKGMKCDYTGTGHVASQSPKAGTAVTKGGTVKVILK
ncbi:MAG: transpeptidase family protein [Bacteroidales bacterium]|nr:transpeptidase family protein [Bacteroidales bacterium]